MRTTRWLSLAASIAIACTGIAVASLARAQETIDSNTQAGEQVLTQGPIHEAFAAPLLYDPKPGPVVSKQPPAPINEIPPEEKPAGQDVQWIPGYWAWDDSRGDFVWVSGVWRKIPPRQQWIPGYWRQVGDGYQWVTGYWGATDATQAQYLTEPPASLEQGPTSPTPAPDSTWIPGVWVWQDDQYAWRPGFWVDNQPGWMWIPASYSWTPSGYLFNQGYWDYPLAIRGMPFAPVYFPRATFPGPGFAYSPGVSLLISALEASLFVRPAYGSYYFGDYYAPNYFQSGIYPWYAYHGSRFGYDPLYAYAAAQNLRTNPNWASDLHRVYQYRRNHPEARPPRTFAETKTIGARPAAGRKIPAAASNLVLARALSPSGAPVAGTGTTSDFIRLERIDQARRQQFARQATELHQFRENRLGREVQAGPSTPPPTRRFPRRLEMPRSPIVAPSQPGGQALPVPTLPRQPQFDQGSRPSAPGATPRRAVPGPETPPPGINTPPPAARRPAAPRPGAAPARKPGAPASKPG
jgi:hypothetical protein